MSCVVRWPRLSAAVFALLAAVAPAQATACADPPQPELTRQPLAIDTSGGRYGFTVEVAVTEEERSCGLMMRERLGPAEGMLFSYDPPGAAFMWMANTLVPLDMLFIDAGGRIVHLELDARPGDRTPRGTQRPVRGVLELRAGTVKRLGIRLGDVIRHPLFAR